MEQEDCLDIESNAIEAMQMINFQLSTYVHELEEHNRALEMLGGLTTLLHTCRNLEDARLVISKAVRKIFASESGCVYLCSGSRDALEQIAAWGNKHPVMRTCDFRTGDGQLNERVSSQYFPRDPDSLPGKDQSEQDASLCVPIQAQSQTLGWLAVRMDHAGENTNAEGLQRRIQRTRQLAATVSEAIALSLTNIRLREALINQSIRDPLTGLLNRRAMDELLEKEISRAARKKQFLGIIMIDIDHFKRFNDTHGHGAGDALLREFGEFLRRQVRDGDYACRYGGEEFVLIAPEIALASLLLRAERIRAGVRSLRANYGDRALDPVTVSIGVALYPGQGSSGQELLRAADAALYRAKAAGRDRIVAASRAARHLGQEDVA